MINKLDVGKFETLKTRGSLYDRNGSAIFPKEAISGRVFRVKFLRLQTG